MQLSIEGRIYRFSLIAVLIISLFACGYHFPGKGGKHLSDIKTVDIPFFTNKTFESGIENFFTDALINEFLKRGEVTIAKREVSDATITGIIKSFNNTPVSFDKNDSVLEYRATVTLDISLKRNDNGMVIWKASDLSGYHEYTASSNTTTTENNKKEALKKIAEDMAEDIHDMVFEDF